MNKHNRVPHTFVGDALLKMSSLRAPRSNEHSFEMMDEEEMESDSPIIDDLNESEYDTFEDLSKQHFKKVLE